MLRLKKLLRTSASALAAAALCAGLAHAQVINLTSVIDGLQETPPTPSPATGSACLTLDLGSGLLTFNISYSGLMAAEIAAHIHGPAGPGVAAPIMVGLPPGQPKIGSVVLTPAQVAAVSAGNSYINIHTQAFTGGEIRGQILVAPAPSLHCFGDGSFGACPCGNTSIPGNNEGCLHNGGVGARLTFSGFNSLACDSLVLSASQMLGGTAIFIQGDLTPITPMSFGDGLRCTGGLLKRIAVTNVAGGSASIGGSAPIHTMGAITSPGTYGYWAYFRDPSGFCTPLTFNSTNGVIVPWVP